MRPLSVGVDCVLTLLLCSDVGIQDLENGWCFLENIADPSNPASRCYEDTQWSEVDGR